MSDIWHITTRAAWGAAQAGGEYPIPPDAAGRPAPFIHCCCPAQLAGVVRRFYPDADDSLVVLVLDPAALTAPLRFEPASDASGDFPHVYGPIALAAVRDVRSLSVALAVAAVRRAGPADAEVIGHLLHDFNVEFDEPTPAPDRLAERMRQLFAGTDFAVWLAGVGPDGLVVVRSREAIWSFALEAYIAELYVVPARRGQGLGRALMITALDAARAAGADYIELGTSEDDVVARKLYESLGFSNREGPDGPVMYVYERPV